MAKATRSSCASTHERSTLSAVEDHVDRTLDDDRSRSAAFFDLDRTLMAGSSGFHFVRAAYAAGMISRRRLAADTWAALRFRLFGSTDAATARVRARMGAYIEGRQVRDMQRLAPRVLAGVLPRLYPQMLELAYAHQDAGRPVYICTAASHEMANALSYILGFDGAIGSRSEVRDGVYTGREGGLFAYREEKARAIRELARSEGISLETSYAYSDSESDLPMLRAVGNPVAVNPDTALARIARDAGWEVLRFDRLHRRLKIGVALAAAAAGGLGGSALRRSPPPPQRRGLRGHSRKAAG